MAYSHDLKQRVLEYGDAGGGKIDREKLRQAVQEQPDLMLKELARAV
jgi:hypothetical protein